MLPAGIASVRRAAGVVLAVAAACAPACVLDLDGLEGGVSSTGHAGASSTGHGGAGTSTSSSSGSGGGSGGSPGCALFDCSCAAAPVVVATGPTLANLPRGIALDADGLYWASSQGGNVVRFAASASAPASIVSASTPVGVAVAGSTLVWTADDGVHACALPACSDAHRLAKSAAVGSVQAVAFDGQALAFTDRGAGPGEGAAYACTLAGCTPLALDDGLVAAHAVAIHAGYAFWTDEGDGNMNGSVERSPTSTKDLQQLSASLQLPAGVDADDTYAYWTEHLPGGHVYRCAIADGYCDTPEDIAPAAGGLGSPGDIHVAEGRVYWTNDDDGSIRSCPQPGCGSAMPEVHVTGRQGLERFAVGSSCLFWTEDDGGGAVLKVAR
jgi:hypothetical protein